MNKIIEEMRAKMMDDKHVEELVKAGGDIDVKVTPTTINGHRALNIRDLEFTDYVTAAIYLRHIHESEIPQDRSWLVA